ncbi:circadian clock-controlled protein daywake-like [Atheta coriaria]|uniref:circadian clock-controlled protein daywake-like n=1 Tax=Dalotia coriaria TaxID=877792 RepID=UPI0031F46EA2
MLHRCVFAVFCLVLYVNAEIPSFIKVCKATNPDLGGCIKSSVLTLQPNLAKGIPELDVPVLEPFDVDDLSVRTNLNINITDFKLHNLLAFEILDISASYEKYQFAFVLKFTNVEVSGDYTIDTKLLTIPLQGHGPLTGRIGSIHFIGKLKGKRIQINGENHIELRFLEFKITDWKNVKFSMSGLFPDNKQLAEAATRVVEDNSDVLLEEMVPTLETNLNRKITEIANKIVRKFTEEEIFPKN